MVSTFKGDNCPRYILQVVGIMDNDEMDMDLGVSRPNALCSREVMRDVHIFGCMNVGVSNRGT